MAGQIADDVAAATLLADYQSRKSPNTLRRQRADLALFTRYLTEAGVPLQQELMDNLEAWHGITAGLVDGFVRWQLQQSYALGSVNVRLATIKSYCMLAARAGVLESGRLALIQAVRGYRQAEAHQVDAKRIQAGLATRRRGAKKAEATRLSLTQAERLKVHAPHGVKQARDRLLLCLALNQGLRVGEIASLNVGSFNLEAGQFTFYREKVHLTQTHWLEDETCEAVRMYLQERKLQLHAEQTAVAMEGAVDETNVDQAPLFIGPCSKQRISVRTLRARVRALGQKVGIERLSPHDGRHAWATQAARAGTDLKSLQDGGGWNSPAMPLRYIASATIANEGVKLRKERGL
ncbi:MAG TPA: tyrosine-type recombinase/integrase [Ktedonobacteraceae bacterium]|nr:tyrosine-type recombinase/integrase [Ktedonobacteraceae bacterium]